MPLRKGVTVTGLKDLQRNLKRLGPRVFKKAIAPALNKEAQRILGVAVDMVSVDSGLLQRNVAVIRAKMKTRRGIPIEIESGFVFLQIYAAQHHEGLPANGTQFWPGGGQRKYAESAIKENIRAYTNALRRAINDAL